MYVGEFSLYIVHHLEAGCPGSTPKGFMRKLRKILQEHGYDEDFIENINLDMGEGYYIAIDIIKHIHSDYWQSVSSFEHSGEDDEKLFAPEMNLDIMRRLVCTMAALRASSFSNLAKAQNKLREILDKYEYEVDDINADIVAGYNLGMDMLMEEASQYIQKLEHKRS